MACRGVHFAIEDGVMRRLLEATGDDAVLEVVEEIEQAWDQRWLHQCDKSWDALFRCLGDGTLDVPESFVPPSAAILSNEQLYEGHSYYVSLVRPERVREVADALKLVSKAQLRERYFALDPSDYDGEIGEDDFEYTWSWFTGLPELFDRAAAAGRAVIFTVDQ